KATGNGKNSQKRHFSLYISRLNVIFARNERTYQQQATPQHPQGPFLYRSYIVLISFLYQNIRTI
ncbi:MAG: hypothetical protein IKJ40_09995, partial [Bacteroidales bacterium]|nr:hypothetical protein [Bacteroidales bacterium]